MVSHKVLVAVDGSRQSLDAVRYVSRMFPPDGTQVVLCCVMSKVPEFFDDLGQGVDFAEGTLTAQAWERALKESVNTFLEQCHRTLTGRRFPPGSIQLKTMERRAGIARDILSESQGNYTGVVAGRTGLNPEMGSILGSVASKLLEKVAHTSLCLVGGKPETGRVLVALDASENAMKGVDFVASLAGGPIFEVKLFHVLRGVQAAWERSQDMSVNKQGAALAEWGVTEIEAVFKEAKEKLAAVGMDPRSIHTEVVSGTASRAAAIVQEARTGGFGTIVVGRRGLSKVQEFFMGRVGNKVIHLANDRAVWVVS